MFCPQCGSEVSEGAAFCPRCGNMLAERRRELQPSVQASSPAARGDAAPGRGAAQPKRKAPAAIVLGVAAVVIAAFVGFNAFASSGGARQVSQPVPTAVASQPSSPDASEVTGILSENAANRISPKEHLAISDLKIDIDPINRYVITGKVGNSSSDTCNVKIAFGYVEHSSDKYGEEQTRERGLTNFTTVTPYCEDGYELSVYDLKGGETRDFTLYPAWGSVELKYTDIKAEVTEVSLPEASVQSRYDHDGLIQIDAIEYTADGKVEIDFTNNSNMYLDEVEVVVLGYNKDGLPIADGDDARPYGSERYSGAANILKPNDKGHISFDVGEGLSKVEVQHVIVTPDKDKNTWQ